MGFELDVIRGVLAHVENAVLTQEQVLPFDTHELTGDLRQLVKAYARHFGRVGVHWIVQGRDRVVIDYVAAVFVAEFVE